MQTPATRGPGLGGEQPVLADVKGLFDQQALTRLGITAWRLWTPGRATTTGLSTKSDEV